MSRWPTQRILFGMIGERHLHLFLCGDVMTGRGVDQVLPHPCPPRLYESVITSALDYVALAERVNGRIPRPVEYPYIWGDALEALERTRPDARIINLETSITTSDEVVPKGINYRMSPRNLPVLTAAGIECCVLANNHVLDWGEVGLLETLDTLAAGGIRAAGAGTDADTARAPAVLEVGDEARVVVFAFGATDSGIPRNWAAGRARPGVHLLPARAAEGIDQIARRVAAVRRAGDVVVASIHWGGNWGYQVPAAHRRWAHGLIERAAVDVVHGHSSHHPKAIEVYRDRLILYGTGDFLNDYEGIAGYDEFRDELVLMYLPTLDAATGRLVGLDMVPFRIQNFRLNRPSAADRAWLRDTLDRECRRFGGRVALREGGLVLEYA